MYVPYGNFALHCTENVVRELLGYYNIFDFYQPSKGSDAFILTPKIRSEIVFQNVCTFYQPDPEEYKLFNA
jgi:hypothetical protein